jgi:pyruvate dehydrogenase E1 component alpha subunit
MFDPELYRDKAEVDAWKSRDPIATHVARLKAAGVDDDAIAAIDRDIVDEIARCVAFAESADWEPVEDLLTDVYTPRP